jgi:hypothetical protein
MLEISKYDCPDWLWYLPWLSMYYRLESADCDADFQEQRVSLMHHGHNIFAS